MSTENNVQAEKRKRPYEDVDGEQQSTTSKRLKESNISLLTLSDDVLLMIFDHLGTSGINYLKYEFFTSFTIMASYILQKITSRITMNLIGPTPQLAY